MTQVDELRSSDRLYEKDSYKPSAHFKPYNLTENNCEIKMFE